MTRKQIADKTAKNESPIVAFQKEYEKLIKKYNVGVIDPIVGFDMIAFLSNFSERHLYRLVDEDESFPTIYELSYKNKGCKLSDVQRWIESYKKRESIQILS